LDPRKSAIAWEKRKTYQALHSADQQTLEDLTGLITVADVLEGLCAVLASYVEEDLLTTRVLIDEARAVVDLVVDDEVEILLGVVLGDLLESEFLGGGHCD
jgi:hypothetical protein